MKKLVELGPAGSGQGQEAAAALRGREGAFVLNKFYSAREAGNFMLFPWEQKGHKKNSSIVSLCVTDEAAAQGVL